MTTRHSPIEDPAELVLVITRVLDAPRSLAFKVWTKPEHMMRWLGPRDFTDNVLQDGLPTGRHLSRLHTLARRPRLLDAGCLSRDRRA